MSVSFKVQGEFITNLAREKCFHEGNFQYAMNLLQSCMVNDQVSKNEIYDMALAILDGRAELKGTYPNDDYGFFYLEEQNEKWSLNKLIEKLSTKAKTQEKEYNDLLQKYGFFMNRLEDWEKQSLNREYKNQFGEPLFNDVQSEPSIRNEMLDSYIKRQMMDTDDDYGWLEPNGTFHPVEWGKHEDWADKWMKKNMSEEDYIAQPYTSMSGDYLVERGWVLLHNPSLGIAFVTKSNIRELTEAQKDFLYDYYLKRDCEKEADDIYNS